MYKTATSNNDHLWISCLFRLITLYHLNIRTSSIALQVGSFIWASALRFWVVRRAIKSACPFPSLCPASQSLSVCHYCDTSAVSRLYRGNRLHGTRCDTISARPGRQNDINYGRLMTSYYSLMHPGRVVIGVFIQSFPNVTGRSWFVVVWRGSWTDDTLSVPGERWPAGRTEVQAGWQYRLQAAGTKTDHLIIRPTLE